MPEGPEIHISSLYINESVKDLIFSGSILKSDVSKNPSIEWDVPCYTIRATSRGKELKLVLEEYDQQTSQSNKSTIGKKMSILFRFGMSGCFKLTTVDDIPKHSHLRFYTSPTHHKQVHVLNFVDFRRFGHWLVNVDWSAERGPCPITDYENFRENVLNNLEQTAFRKKPICEVLLNQKYFNGIGNYLRAEILFRSKIPPFEDAHIVLSKLKDLTDSKKTDDESLLRNDIDPLYLCHALCHEVLKLSGGYDVINGLKEDGAFEKWLQCYQNPDMQSLVDSKKRTIWFSGDPGSLVPIGSVSRKPIKKRKLTEKIEVDPELVLKKVLMDEKPKNIDRLPTRRSPRFHQEIMTNVKNLPLAEKTKKRKPVKEKLGM